MYLLICKIICRFNFHGFQKEIDTFNVNGQIYIMFKGQILTLPCGVKKIREMFGK